MTNIQERRVQLEQAGLDRTSVWLVLRREGFTFQQIGDEYGVSRQRVEQVAPAPATGASPRNLTQYKRIAHAVAVAAKKEITRAHGTVYRYRTFGCRCPECTEAHRQYCRVGIEKRKGQEPPMHGASAYVNWQCRCPVCTAAHTAACRERAQRKRAAVAA